MPIKFTCSCGEKIEVDDELAGRQARCPYCEAVVDVPAATPRSSAAKRAKPAPPRESDDDHGAYAGSLDPDARSNRRSSRRRDEDDEDDDRPSRRRRDDDEDEDDRPRRRSAYNRDDDDDDRPSRRRKNIRRRQEPEYKLLNGQVVGGAVMMFIGISVTVLLAFFGIYWLWMLVLTVIGLISLIRGLATGRDG
jgi:hypothetical protein